MCCPFYWVKLVNWAIGAGSGGVGEGGGQAERLKGIFNAIAIRQMTKGVTDRQTEWQ